MSRYGNYKPDFFKTAENTPKMRLKRFWLSIYKNILPFFKKAAMGFFLAFSVISCSTPQAVVEKENIVYVYSDSTRIKDSTVIIPIERYVDIVPQYDTLQLSTSLAIAQSWLDTSNHILRGKIWNIKAVEYKYIENEHIVYKDSIVERQVPQPYPVIEEKRYIPTFAWICIVWAVVSIVLIGIWLYMKFWR